MTIKLVARCTQELETLVQARVNATVTQAGGLWNRVRRLGGDVLAPYDPDQLRQAFRVLRDNLSTGIKPDEGHRTKALNALRLAQITAAASGKTLFE